MRQLRLAFGFFTVLPFSRAGSMEEIAGAGMLLPLIAVFLGGVEGLSGWGFSQAFGPQVTAALVLSLALLLTGLHHADGLADVGDAVMAGGTPSRRLAVLKDRTTGIGALAALLLTYFISWAALSEAIPSYEPQLLPWLLIAIEVSARVSLLTVATISRPSHRGSGSAFIARLKGWRGAAASGLSLAIMAGLILPLGVWTPIGCWLAAMATAVSLTLGGSRWFGGANGDLLGASVELGRMTALLAAAAAIDL